MDAPNQSAPWHRPGFDPLRLARSTSDPCGLQNFCYQFSQHWTHIFSLKKSPRLNSQLTISTSKIRWLYRKIEKSKPSQAAATTSPQFPRFVRFSASICHGKEHGSQMQRRRFLNDRRFGGGFIHLVPPKPSQTWCLFVARAGRAHFFWLKSGGNCGFLVHFSARMSRFRVGWGGTVTFITLRSWHDALGFSFRHSWGWGRLGGAITSFGTCTHVMLPLMSTCSIGLTSPMCLSRDVLRCVMGFALVSLMLTCTRGLKSPMCFARDVLRCVMGFGVVRFMLTCILDGDGWRSRF